MTGLSDEPPLSGPFLFFVHQHPHRLPRCICPWADLGDFDKEFASCRRSGDFIAESCNGSLEEALRGLGLLCPQPRVGPIDPLNRFKELPGGTKKKIKHYYPVESIGLACGFLLAALHWMGLATLTHTPSPMGFLSEILERPENERPFLLIPVGYPAPDAQVPDIAKKPLSETVVRVE